MKKIEIPNITKRLVVPASEENLFKPFSLNGKSQVVLADYMGGDEMVERVATAGFGREIFPEQPSTEDFLNHLYAKRILEPFRSVQLQFQINSSIADALHLVYAQKASVNEYSGRYSEMPETTFLPSVEYLAARMSGSSDSDALSRAQQAIDLMQANRVTNFAEYKRTVSEEIDLARELARTPLEIDNDTMFYWKMDLPSLVEFIDGKRALMGDQEDSLHEFLDTLDKIAVDAAPYAVAALRSNTLPMHLTFPKDEEIIDSALRPAQWDSQETKRPVAEKLEEKLFIPVSVLDYGQVQGVDYMGHDLGPAESARISYGQGTTRKSRDTGLMRYLLRNAHTTPYERNELAVETKAPVFIDPRQAGRHRTLDFHCFMGTQLVGSQFYLPDLEEIKKQSKTNKQGRANTFEGDQQEELRYSIRDRCNAQNELALQLRELGVDEDTIRRRKGVGFYTKTWRTGDSHNWLHYLGLRLDSHAQKEIRVVSEPYAELLGALSPTTYQALRDYKLNAIKFSALELPVLSELMSVTPEIIEDKEFYKAAGLVTKKGAMKREGLELQSKLRTLYELGQSSKSSVE